MEFGFVCRVDDGGEESSGKVHLDCAIILDLDCLAEARHKGGPFHVFLLAIGSLGEGNVREQMRC
jgi:hypothetical protein